MLHVCRTGFIVGAVLATSALLPVSGQAAAPVLKAPAPSAGKVGTPPGTGPVLPGIPLPDATPDSKPNTTPDQKPGGANPGGTRSEPKPKTKDDHGASHDPDKVIQSIELPAKPALILTAKSKWEDGYKTIGKLVAALKKEATRLQLKPAGQPLVIYLENTDNDFRFDVLLPIAAKISGPVKLADGIRIGSNPGGTALKFEHRGPYSKIEDTYEAITAYLDEKSLIAREFFIEEFLSDLAGPADGKHVVNIYVFLR